MHTAAQHGLGDAQSAQYTQIAGSAAATGVAAAAAAHLIAGAAAGPIGAGIALAAFVVSQLIANSGCGPTCILATKIVDQIEPQLKANRDAYLSGHRTAEDQAAALTTFDATMAWLSSGDGCGNPQLGDAGKACIKDRNRGGKWDWYTYYRDPITAAPPLTTADAVTTAAGDLGIPSDVLIVAAVMIAAVVLL